MTDYIDPISLEEQIATLTAERDAARARCDALVETVAAYLALLDQPHTCNTAAPHSPLGRHLADVRKALYAARGSVKS